MAHQELRPYTVKNQLLQVPEISWTPNNYFSTANAAGNLTNAITTVGAFIKWTSILSYIGLSEEFGNAPIWSDRYLTTPMPAVGTAIPLLGTNSTRVVTSSGIPLAPWETLGLSYPTGHTGTVQVASDSAWVIKGMRPHSSTVNFVPIAQYLQQGITVTNNGFGPTLGMVGQTQEASRVWCLGHHFPLGAEPAPIGNLGALGATPYYRPALYGAAAGSPITTVASYGPGWDFGYKINCDGNRNVNVTFTGLIRLNQSSVPNGTIIAMIPGCYSSRGTIRGTVHTQVVNGDGWHRPVRLDYENITVGGVSGLALRIYGYVTNMVNSSWISFESQFISLN